MRHIAHSLSEESLFDVCSHSEALFNAHSNGDMVRIEHVTREGKEKVTAGEIVEFKGTDSNLCAVLLTAKGYRSVSLTGVVSVRIMVDGSK